jgi:molybdenum cofactor cytidylyltransferase
MGRPKLILPVGGEPLIARLVAALRAGGTGRVVVVAPVAEAPGAPTLIAEARARGAEVVVPEEPPPDMRASIELGLARLARGPAPLGVFLAPGDSPGTTTELVGRLVERYRADPTRIVVPGHAGRRGHPVLLPWILTAEIPGLPPGVGANALLKAHADRVVIIEADPSAVADLDTPADYLMWGP